MRRAGALIVFLFLDLTIFKFFPYIVPKVKLLYNCVPRTFFPLFILKKYRHALKKSTSIRNWEACSLDKGRKCGQYN